MLSLFKIRKFRPPGNFASIQTNQYTTAKIPLGVGVRLFVGKLVERIYVDAAMARNEASSGDSSSETAFSGGNKIVSSSLDTMRKSLGHPFSTVNTVHCLVASFNGFDVASFSDRASVAARLWMEGVAAEYFGQGGAVTTLRQNANSLSYSNEAIDEVEVSLVYNMYIELFQDPLHIV